MSFNIEHYKKDIIFIPLGGTNEIGMNFNLYHYKGKWLIIDCGSYFGDNNLPGVDITVPNIDFITQYKNDIIGMILTHAHEDHIGGIPYLWQYIKCPIYTTLFTANVLNIKLQNHNLKNEIQINIIEQDTKISLKPFLLQLISITHSIPEMQAVLISTDQGKILHTGDWKFDKNPVLGKKTNEKLLTQSKNEGLLAIICDSTNVFHVGHSGSEGELKKSLIEIIKNCKKMVVVSTFASNLARIESLIDAAQLSNRKVVISGKSLKNIISAGKASGYLNNIKPFIDEKKVRCYKRDELLIIATGCQGEPLATTNKLADNKHPYIQLTEEDTVIFSSKIIPGNEKKIFNLLNKFVQNNINVITEKENFVHVTGHPCRNDLKKMYQITNPLICIPVHGEQLHIHTHAKFAYDNGIKHVIKVKNGSIVIINKKFPRIISQIPTVRMAISGNELINSESHIFQTRINISKSGIIAVVIICNQHNILISTPNITMLGVINLELDKNTINIYEQELYKFLLQNDTGNLTNMEIEKLINKYFQKVLKHKINYTPKIIISINKI